MPDRSYYRSEDDRRLIDEAKYNPNRELAIALGERLADVLATAEQDVDDLRKQLKDAELDATQIEHKLWEQERQNDCLLQTIDALTAELEALKKETEQ